MVEKIFGGKIIVEGDFPLGVACRVENYAIIEMLVEKGVNIDQVDENGRTCLHWVLK